MLIGAPRSGEGKTTVALGIMAALRRRGLNIQGFKVGPDYLDTGYQRFATGTPGRTLDLWMMGETPVLSAVTEVANEVDVAVIEGVMGLFDGHRDGHTPTSSAEVAAVLDAPVVLVIDASRMAASVGALAYGFATFDERVNVAGVILNRWKEHRDPTAVTAALAKAGVELLGLLPAAPDIALPSRHLGLCVADELGAQTTATMDRLAEHVAATVDLERLLRIAQSADRPAGSSAWTPPETTTAAASGSHTSAAPLRSAPGGWEPPPAVPVGGVRIAVALDDAFAFYYEDNLRELRRAGAELVPCSPLTDQTLPPCDGLYLGGGYPELHAPQLSRNEAFRARVAESVRGGLPTYAECGGLLYLAEQLDDLDGRTWPMVGLVPAAGRVHQRLQNMGYREARLVSDCLLGAAGQRLRGHEFHYSSCTIEYEGSGGPAYELSDCDGRRDGYTDGALFASYVHLHFAGCPSVVASWLDACRSYRARSTAAAVAPHADLTEGRKPDVQSDHPARSRKPRRDGDDAVP